MKTSVQISLIGALGLISLCSIAANVTQINRYATVANKPLAAQINPLLSIQQVHFPQEVQTISQAVEWWLKFSGFSLVSKEKQPESLQTVMRQALPQIDRNLGPLTVKDGLEVLVGQQSFALIKDPLLRQVNFKLKAGVRNGGKS
ncbi:hypothetical protein SCO11_11270 [Legionella pneumophila serogroup 1]|uniref:Integrating conjugative element protein PilL, PFGI-1 class n=1 Tax=Legionella pneumophila TaxID=446 RepID=A0AAN5PSK9_LEGPN|nr:hypothetical protein [Legionella pneumophila]AMV14883.1 hypothetical protein ULM_22180 [Legionella pneumophila]ANN93065.1 hypothetical protein A9P85_10700 [Legionella pneumophila]MCH9061575.1 hypothetical protein [Legionella pneumophila serogroup 1]MCH9064365.1 hypothetical protein [Legionella pneumophila serogroup 1]MCH9066777.1 hypothetical protein [Legionella pneumophila serogroup 1]